jgi:hypothetical protein
LTGPVSSFAGGECTDWQLATVRETLDSKGRKIISSKTAQKRDVKPPPHPEIAKTPVNIGDSSQE